jgi:hypothetical protein
MIKTEYCHFSNREIRTKYVADHYADYLKGRILDVGCDRSVLKSLLRDIEYTGIDMQGTPDIHHDLDKTPRLPFEDNAFDCVLCADVLEHLDHFQEVFDDLVRVFKKYLIISLPNCWCAARKRIERGKGSFKHYGLPAEKPADRHKWFFSLSEAMDFAEAQKKKHGLNIIDMHATEKPRPAIVRFIRKIRYINPECYANRYAHSLWMVFSK